MVARELPTKFGLDPSSGFRETWVYVRRKDGQTDDGRLRHDSSSADKSSRDNEKGCWSII